MDKKWKQMFFERLTEKTAEITEQYKLEEEDGDLTLQAGFTTVRGGRGVCIFETQLREDFEGAPTVEMIATPTFTIESEDAFSEMIDAIININLYTPMGAFGYYDPTHKIYFRHVGFVDDGADAAEEADKAASLYEKVAIVVGNVYDSLERIAAGETTFEDEAESDNLPSQI